MTGIIVAATIIGLIVIVGSFALFFLLPVLLALLGAAVLLVMMVAVVILLLPNFVTLDEFKPQIIEALSNATGREIAIGGPIGFSVWPVLGLQLRDISVGNPEGARMPIMLAAQQVGVGVTLSSLMDHRLELRELRIVGGQLNLSTDSKGRANWQMKLSEDKTADDQATGDADANQTGSDFAIRDISIEKIEVVDTSVSYEKAGAEPVDLDDIDLTFSMPSLDKAASFKGDVGFRGREVQISGQVGDPRALKDGGHTDVKLTASFGGDRVAFTGNVENAILQGQLTASSSDLSALAGWASGAPAALPVKSFELASTLKASAAKAELSSLNLAVDDIKVAGAVTAALAGAKPRVDADVSVSPLDLDKFMTGEGSSAAATETAAASAQAPDLSALDMFNADVTARLAGLTVKGATLGATTAKLVVQGGRLQFSMTPASLYEGSVVAKAEVSPGSRGSRSFSASATLDGVQMEPVLTQFAGFTRLSGKGDASFNVTGLVAAPDAMKRSIGGDGKFIFRDGALKGVNIPAMLRNAKAMLGAGRKESEGAQQTDFTELSGTFTIKDGIVSNNDLKMLSPLLRVLGKGTVSLPASTVDYRVEGVLVADLTGQGGALDSKGLVVPINIRGPFSALRYEPDLKGLVLGNAGTAKEIGNVVKDLGTKEGQRNAREAVKGLLGLPTKQQETAPAETSSGEAPATTTEQPAPAEAPAPLKPEDALKSLFGR